MYDENSFQNYIFWIKVKRIFLMAMFSIIGALIGIALSELVVTIFLFDPIFRTIIISISTCLFFLMSLLITANTGKEVQDAYWKIAVLRKLTVMSKKLDVLEHLSSIENLNKEFVESPIKEKDIESTTPTANTVKKKSVVKTIHE